MIKFVNYVSKIQVFSSARSHKKKLIKKKTMKDKKIFANLSALPLVTSDPGL